MQPVHTLSPIIKWHLTICLILSINLAFSQGSLDFKFYDNCTESIIKCDFDILLIGEYNDLPIENPISIEQSGLYIITVYKDYGNYRSSHDFTKELCKDKVYSDTIELPKIEQWFETKLHSSYWKFHCCTEICNGRKVALYRSGEKWIEGEFKDGIPVRQLNYYNKEGVLIKKEIYGKRGLKRIKYPEYEKLEY